MKARAEHAKKSDRIAAAVVGLGIGRGHLRALRTNPSVRVVGVCDKSPERIDRVRQEHPDLPEAAFFDDYEKMLASTKPEAVIVALPN